MSTDKKETKKEIIRQNLLELQSEARIVRKIVFIIAVVLFLVAGGVTAGGYFYIKSALEPADPGSKAEKNIEIPIGSSVSGIAQILEDNGIIKDARVFKYYVKFKNESGFMAGDYKLKPSMSIPEIIERLKTGKAMQEVVLKITIPEGKQLKQIAGIIAEKTNKNEEEVFNKLNNKSFVKAMMAKYPDILTDEILNKNVKYPLEGYLFPATYSFYKENPTVEEIVTVMLDKTKSVLQEYEGQMEEKHFSVHQLLTMASLVEEEATEKADRDRIASVFYNRIKTGMPLQTDPTVLYAKGKHQERVLYKDLEVDSPYNTYKHKGLPPGPIANAGTISIEAALNPEKTDFLYFLATADGDVIFTKTLDEHNKAKAEHITNK
ncbi:endolytic transglycosylase MltG [Bacillus methanolicus]|uniref:endolytic transglycosylase MltG n=1 Tax=Bacillus methanolicus TaxID=1471 RepID=UPI002380B4D4|nr:endolytic transglycosylase MltG [Bacillus methanolicus]MDE3839707.1 endolytic transglycosylase MltG [Bacillus methanolicus]